MRTFNQGIIIAGIVSICFSLSAEPYKIFVSPAGNDTNTGTFEAPFKTLEKVRDAAVKVKEGDTCIIILLSGIYKIDKPLTISGARSAPLVIKSKKTGGAVLCGGTELKPALSRKCDKKDLDAGINKRFISRIRKWTFADAGIIDTAFWSMTGIHNCIILQLFCDNKRMLLARWPDDSFARIDSVLETMPKIRKGKIIGDSVGRVICRNATNINKWVKENGHAFLHGYFFWDWYDNIELIDSINTINAAIKTKPPYCGYGYRKGQRFYAANLLCELDREGEWCVDPERKLIYFWPPSESKNKSAWLTINTGGLVILNGVSNVRFEDITFECSLKDLVVAKACTSVVFDRCVFRNTGGNGITMSSTFNCTVMNCEFVQIGKTAVAVSGGVRKTLTPSNIRIVNNRIHEFGQVKRTCEPAVRIWDDGVGCYVGSNSMYDAPHTAIMFMGNHHLIEKNHIYNVCTETQDAGVIYTGRDWTVRGTVIKNNFIENCGAGDINAVYLDDQASGIIIEGNRIKNVPRSFLVGGGRDNVLCNNTIADSREWLRADNRGIKITGNLNTLHSRLSAVPYKDSFWSAAYPSLVNILDDDPGCPKGNIIKGNLLINAGKSSIAPEIERYGIVDSNVVLDSIPADTNKYGADW